MDNTVTETRTEVTTVTEEITIERKQPKTIEKDVELIECAICDTLEQEVIPITVGFREPPLNDDAAHAVVCEYCAIHVLNLGRANLVYLDVEKMDHRGKRFHDLRDAHNQAFLVIVLGAVIGGIVATLLPPFLEWTWLNVLVGAFVYLAVLLRAYPENSFDYGDIPDLRSD